jgi:hypothetical protein
MEYKSNYITTTIQALKRSVSFCKADDSIDCVRIEYGYPLNKQICFFYNQKDFDDFFKDFDFTKFVGKQLHIEIICSNNIKQYGIGTIFDFVDNTVY